MSEIENPSKTPGGNPETHVELRGLRRRTFLKGAGLVAAGAAGGVFTDRLYGIFDSESPPLNTLSSADYDRIERAALKAKKQAAILQTLINRTIETKIPVEISVLEGSIDARDEFGNPTWLAYNPIILGEPPKIDEKDSGFMWFGIQAPDLGAVDRSPSVNIQSMLFDRRYMGLSYFVPSGQEELATSQMRVLAMSPNPESPAIGPMVAYAVAYNYDEYPPGYRTHQYDDPSQWAAPGLQVPQD